MTRTSIRKQLDGTYLARYRDTTRAWPRRQQDKERSAAEPVVDFWTGHAVLSYADVGKVFGITGSRVQQIERLALRKMRAALREDGTEREWFE